MIVTDDKAIPKTVYRAKSKHQEFLLSDIFSFLLLDPILNSSKQHCLDVRVRFPVFFQQHICFLLPLKTSSVGWKQLVDYVR